MEDTVNKNLVLELGKMIEENKGVDTVCLDISGVCSWTDYFVITSVNSFGQLRGLVKIISRFLAEKGIQPVHSLKKVQEEGWLLIDCSSVVIHIMSKESRSFYELENLWFNGERVYPV